MKRLLFLSVLTLAASGSSFGAAEHSECSSDDSVTAQASALLKVAEKLEGGDCPAPKASDYKSFCADITTKTKVTGADTDFYEYLYEKRLWDVSCADPSKHDSDQAKTKINQMWKKYHKQFKCDSLGFNVSNGNILKFSISQSLPDFIDTLVSNYNLDINFIDPSDNKNVLDYLNDEIKRFETTGVSQDSIKIYKDYRQSLIKLGAKPSK